MRRLALALLLFTSLTLTAPDGVRIVYDDRGQGATALVFVHCWSCDRTFWREQADVFSDGYRVVTLDLAGHGESGKNRKTWTVAGLGGDVRAVVEKLGLKRVILVGHSMGGPVSLDAARQLRGRVVGVGSRPGAWRPCRRTTPPEASRMSAIAAGW
jgi:pimeloyl-ACP methyl ester carboxylesterase